MTSASLGESSRDFAHVGVKTKLSRPPCKDCNTGLIRMIKTLSYGKTLNPLYTLNTVCRFSGVGNHIVKNAG